MNPAFSPWVHSREHNRAEPVGFTVMPLSEDSHGAAAGCCLAAE